jgi:hypothetical protein
MVQVTSGLPVNRHKTDKNKRTELVLRPDESAMPPGLLLVGQG